MELRLEEEDCICGERFTTFERVQFRELRLIKMEENHLLTERSCLNQFMWHLKKDQ